MAEAISIHRKIDSDAVSFHFGVQFAVRYDLAGSAVEEVGGLLFATALLTEDGDAVEDFDCRTMTRRVAGVSHSGPRENYKDYKMYRNSVRPRHQYFVRLFPAHPWRVALLENCRTSLSPLASRQGYPTVPLVILRFHPQNHF